MQEADWFKLVNTIAEILRTDQQMATDRVVKKVNEVVKQHRIRAGFLGRLAEERPAAHRANEIQKAGRGT